MHPRYPTAGVGVGGRDGVWGRFEHPRLAEVVPNCLVAFYDTRHDDTRSESWGIFYHPIPTGGLGGGSAQL